MRETQYHRGMIGRPHESEAAPYYFTYINQVPSDDPFRVLESQTDEVGKFLMSISEESSLFRYSPEKWSIRQAWNHVTDTERALAFRALWFARGFDSPLPSYDQNIAADHAGADAVPWTGHIQEFRQVRLATIAMFRNMPSEAWMRFGIASDNKFSVRALAYIIAGHVIYHQNILRDRYLKIA